MASQTLRPHRSPSPSPSPATPTMGSNNPAKLTRQSLGPPPSSTGAAKGFGGLGGVSSPTSSQPRHVSSGGVMPGNGNRDSFGSRPSLGGNTPRGMPAGGRPSSEFLPGFSRDKTPEAEQIDQWFKHLANWEQTLEEMAAASTDQNFTEELGAIESWFRVLSEAERTAALYSLLQHSTPVQIRFLSSVLHHMAQADPLSAAMLSPNPNTAAAGFAAQMDKLNTFKSPSAGGGNGYTGSPNPNQYLGPDDAQKAKLRQNRISAPGTLQPHDRWQGQQLDQVLERGPSPDNLSSRSRSPGGDLRPKSTDFAGQANRATSPRQSGVGLGLDGPISPLLNNTSWASMVNTPLAPVFNDGKSDHLTSAALNMANLQLAANKVALDDARKYRRPTAGGTSSRNVSGQSETSSHAGQAASPMLNQYGAYPRSPVLDQFGLGLGDNAALAGLGMNFAQLGINPLAANPAQMLALAQAQQQLNNPAYASAGFHGQGGYTSSRPSAGAPTAGRPSAGRRSPMPNVRNSPTPQASGTGTGGGAGGGAGVAGPDDVDPKVLEDTAGWLRVLRLHKYTSTFERTPWKEMAMMTDADLQDKGVAAQGARTKFLKVFHNVRTHMEIPHPPGQEEYAQKADGKA